jgi:hypothetical protein
MNYKLVLVCLGAMLLAQESEGLFLFNRLGRFGFGGPFGFGGLGRFGFGFGGLGLGFGGLGLGLGGFPIPVPVPVPAPIGPGFIGKRAAEHIANITECGISTENQKIVCAGVSELTCDIVSNFTGLGSVSFVIKDLALTKLTELEEPVYHFLAEKEVDKKIINEEHTFINPTDNKPVILSLYLSEKLTDLGFRFKEQTCWEKFEKIVEVTKPEELEFSLFINQA